MTVSRIFSYYKSQLLAHLFQCDMFSLMSYLTIFENPPLKPTVYYTKDPGSLR